MRTGQGGRAPGVWPWGRRNLDLRGKTTGQMIWSWKEATRVNYFLFDFAFGWLGLQYLFPPKVSQWNEARGLIQKLKQTFKITLCACCISFKHSELLNALTLLPSNTCMLITAVQHMASMQLYLINDIGATTNVWLKSQSPIHVHIRVWGKSLIRSISD